MIRTFASSFVCRILLCAFWCLAVLPNGSGKAQLFAQAAPATPPAPVDQQATGLETPWDVRTILEKLNKDNEELKPLLTQLKPQQWATQKGASTVYMLQWQTAQQQLNDAAAASKLLSLKTESLSLGFDLYFRLEAMDVTARSLEEGVRKYGERPVADKIAELLARNFSNRERFRDYLRDLAASVEQDFKIADEEAQRCRGMISKEPPPVARKLRR